MYLTAILSIAPALPAPQPPSSLHSEWRQQTAFEAGNKLGGCAVGDFDPRRPGEEIAVVAGDGRVIEVYRDEEAKSGWGHEVLGELSGEMIQCALGDLLPEQEGLELVTVGVARGREDGSAPGLAVLWYYAADAERWISRPLLGDEALFHAVAIGDIDPDRPGKEVVLGGFSGVVHVGGGFDLSQQELGSWVHRPLAAEGSERAAGNVKGAACGLGGAVLACDDGALLALRKRDGVWAIDELARWKDSPLARVAVDADGALVCSNDGVLRYRQVLHGGGVSSTTNAARREGRLRGAVIADLDPTRPGDEWATAGYDGRVYIVSLTEMDRDEHGLRRIASTDLPVARDDDKFHHLAAGTLPGLGTCLVAVGYSGRVIVVSR